MSALSYKTTITGDHYVPVNDGTVQDDVEKLHGIWGYKKVPASEDKDVIKVKLNVPASGINGQNPFDVAGKLALKLLNYEDSRHSMYKRPINIQYTWDSLQIKTNDETVSIYLKNKFNEMPELKNAELIDGGAELAAGARLIERCPKIIDVQFFPYLADIAKVANNANHHPNVTLDYDGVVNTTVQLSLFSHDKGTVSYADMIMADRFGKISRIGSIVNISDSFEARLNGGKGKSDDAKNLVTDAVAIYGLENVEKAFRNSNKGELSRIHFAALDVAKKNLGITEQAK